MLTFVHLGSSQMSTPRNSLLSRHRPHSSACWCMMLHCVAHRNSHDVCTCCANSRCVAELFVDACDFLLCSLSAANHHERHIHHLSLKRSHPVSVRVLSSDVMCIILLLRFHCELTRLIQMRSPRSLPKVGMGGKLELICCDGTTGCL